MAGHLRRSRAIQGRRHRERAGSYGFLLTATDGQVTGGGGIDLFRPKVWEVMSGAVVYDNVVGEADPLNAPILGGGSVVIHAT